MTDLTFWTAVIAGAFTLCVPVVLAGLGEIILERSGGFNVGIEGIMLLGAASGVVGALQGGFVMGLLSGVAAGALLGFLLGAATAWGRADIIVSGIAVGLLGSGLSIAVYQALAPAGSGNRIAPVQPHLALDWLRAVPLVGTGIADAGPLFGLTLLLVGLVWWFLRQTRLGLRLIAVGDDEAVAAVRGIRVREVRLGAAVVAGAFAGLGGAAVPLSDIGSFTPQMTGGTGFIALAVVIIARRHPGGLLAGALLFAVFNSLALLSQTRDVELPVELYQALPYLATLFVLIVTARRRTALHARSLASPA
ncbi:ABC transporter permease [Nocardioides sp. Bht2]|uniref:ABC transporter permease n=1 Tax=Nocardioides sp. Bht2 TaxID=3392297 RepID=UPI0039B3FF70